MKRRYSVILLAIAAAVISIVTLMALYQRDKNEVSLVLSVPRFGLPEGKLESPSDYQIRRDTYETSLSSPFVLSATLRQHGIQNLPFVQELGESRIAELLDLVKVDSVEGTTTISISISGPDREQTIKFADAFHSAAAREIRNFERDRISEQIESTHTIVKELKREIERKLHQRNVTEKRALGGLDSDVPTSDNEESSVEMISVELEVLVERLKFYEREMTVYEFRDSQIVPFLMNLISFDAGS